jgi:molecular chaperone DnaK
MRDAGSGTQAEVLMQAKQVFGIDLGTTYSCIAFVDEHGRPVVAPNSENALTTPSVVYFESETSIVVGQVAKDIAKVYPDLVVEAVKRHMGDASWSRTFHGRTYRPQDVSALILRKIVGDAEQVLGQKIEDVVITCPAYFGNVEKEATRQAGMIAGLNVRFVVPEPMAAAFSFGVDAVEGETLMVYDLGGGTFDGTLLRVPGTILSTVGDQNLGGKDWEDDLVRLIARKFEAAAGVSPDALLDDPLTAQELAREAEKCKIALSSCQSHKLRLAFGPHSVALEVTREEFEHVTRHRLDRTIDETKILLERGRAKGVSVETILLVGGSTFMPQVEARLRQEFPTCKLLRRDPNQIVAKGAALIGYKYRIDEEIERRMIPGVSRDRAIELVADATSMTPETINRLSKTVFTPVSAKSFGVVTFNKKTNEDEVINLIQVDDPLPVDVTRPVYTVVDQQTSVVLSVVQNKLRVTGEDHVVPLHECEVIGTAEVVFKIPLPAQSQIDVTYTLDLDGILKVGALDVTTRAEAAGAFTSDALLSADALAASHKRAEVVDVR